MSARIAPFAAAASLALIAGCSDGNDARQPLAATAPANGTVPAAVAASDGHRKLAAALIDTQLAPVLDGQGEYTLLAPGDAAFDALANKGSELGDSDRRPLMIAMLRAHILPGQVTLESIAAAVARRKGPVRMRTMAGHTVSFAETGDGLTVANGSATAKLSSASMAASNGAVLPIDTVLMPGR